MKSRIAFLLMTAACVPALAAPVKSSKEAEAPAKVQSSNDYSGNWMVRARAINVAPHESSSVSIGGTVSVNNNVVPEVDLTYFFTPNIAVEAIAATTKHNVRTSGGVDAGSAWLLPPTVTLQYHYTGLSWAKPYVGAGLNYTYFYNEKGGALNHVEYDNSFGAALQAGVDVPVGNGWYVNADVKKLYISTTATFSPSGVTADVDIDPWIVGLGVGYRF